nr:hypothetical protein Iba_chr07aCG7570 [Ipomoea batatas]
MTTMESVEGLVAGVETPAMVPSDALPEPSGDGSTNPSMIELADPVDSGHATPTAMVADESLDTATVEHPPGGHVAQRRSYLDSVETCPTSPRPAVPVPTELPNEASMQATESPVPGPNSGVRPPNMRASTPCSLFLCWLVLKRYRGTGGYYFGGDVPFDYAGGVEDF